ncbi:DUF99 family protein [Natrialba sp. INN-245]|uniref:endonuclease dU n=1 Tax=Natrialba sp. INN-245 TaxID=2690967 RepID=UPI0013130509|nr:DUF99 family protein [Natrialba sp. INN-245]
MTKPGTRALGIAESYRSGRDQSTLAGAVVRADGVVDGLAYGSCTVGGTDATDAVTSLVDDTARPDARYVLVGAVAPAWYNVLELSTIHERCDRPVIAVTFEASDGLEDGIREAFDGAALEHRLEAYHDLPERRALSLGDDTVYARAVGCEFTAATEVLEAFTHSGGRPEPIRVARLAARAADRYAPA